MHHAMNTLRTAIALAAAGCPIKAQGALTRAKRDFAADVLAPELFTKAVSVVAAYAAAHKAAKAVRS